MSTTNISVILRRLVLARAEKLCEYCLLAEEDLFFSEHVDHIISEKHGGQTVAENLAYACIFCTLHKGSDIASVTTGGEVVRLFNPRTDRWAEHFRLRHLTIEPLTSVGEVTVRLLQLNHPDRLLERQALTAVGRYPSSAAARRMS